MLSLIMIEPPGKLESTVKGLKAHHIPDWAFDVTRLIRLGGQYSPSLQGPTPVGLVPPNVPAFVPEAMDILPRFTRVSLQAENPHNWRVSF